MLWCIHALKNIESTLAIFVFNMVSIRSNSTINFKLKVRLSFFIYLFLKKLYRTIAGDIKVNIQPARVKVTVVFSEEIQMYIS